MSDIAKYLIGVGVGIIIEAILISGKVYKKGYDRGYEECEADERIRRAFTGTTFY